MKTYSIITSTAILISLMLSEGCAKKTDMQQTDSSAVVQTQSAPQTPPGPTGTAAPAPATSTAAPKDSNASAAPFDSKKVSIATLPSTVKPYVANHFPAYTIASAAYDPLCGGGPAIDVSIRAKGKRAYSLIFKPDGTFVQQEEDVAIATAPEAVTAAVKKDYGSWRAGKQIERLTLSDGSVEYSFDLSQGKTQKEVIYTSAGVIVCDAKE